MAPGSRRYHSKSRNGCGQCKRRRVKCNLQAPVCRNCQRRGEVCDYQLLEEYSTVSAPLLAVQRQQHALVLVRRGSDGSSDSSSEGSVLGGDPSQHESSQWVDQVVTSASSAFPLRDNPQWPLLTDPLGVNPVSRPLLYNFIRRTSLTLALVVNENQFWQAGIAQAALNVSYVQHAAVAISALHTIRLGVPNPHRYYSAACKHSILASNRFRAEVISINASNWFALMTFVLSLIIFHFDVNSIANEIGMPAQTLTPWETLRILRQTSPLGWELMKFLGSTEIGMRMRIRHTRLVVPRDEKYEEAMDRLVAACERQTPGPDTMVCTEAANLLRSWNQAVSGQPRSWPHVMHFPAAVSEAYDLLLKSSDQVALAIFVYWCTVMNRAPARYYLNSSIKKAAYAAMDGLDESWRMLMEWPRKELQTEPGILFGWMVY